jgi:hypothetical protein
VARSLAYQIVNAENVFPTRISALKIVRVCGGPEEHQLSGNARRRAGLLLALRSHRDGHRCYRSFHALR